MPVIPQKPISPEGGEAEHLSIRLPRGWRAAAEQIARQNGMNRSEYIRSLLISDGIEAFLASQEVATAS